MQEFKVLIIDDEEGMLEVCRDSLRHFPGLRVMTESRSRRAAELLSREAFDILVVDLRMPELDGLQVLKLAREEQPEIQVIMITGFPTVETAVKAIKKGASDYIVKPFTPKQLREKIEQAVARAQARTNGLPDSDPATDRSYDGIIGSCPPMQRVYKMVEQVAPTNSDVLILGESGTGKELVARSIHKRSLRKGRFVPVDCGAIPENLLEAELFGHEKGSFTGASEQRLGLLEFADGGTFFLDEVCELAPSLQAKLLRALQERSFRRVGGKSEVQVDVRIIAATNRDIEREVAEERFRRDLYYRINVVKIAVPPLRERRSDVPLLVDHFVGRFAREMGKALLGLEPSAMQVLLDHSWDGNVRQLQNVLRRAVTMSRTEYIELVDLPEELRGTEDTESTADFFGLRSRKVESFERDYLVELLRKVKGDVSRASKVASLPRATFYRLLKKHEIQPADFR